MMNQKLLGPQNRYLRKVKIPRIFTYYKLTADTKCSVIFQTILKIFNFFILQSLLYGFHIYTRNPHIPANEVNFILCFITSAFFFRKIICNSQANG